MSSLISESALGTAESLGHPATDEIELAGVLQALSDPMRLRIVVALAAGDGAVVQEHRPARRQVDVHAPLPGPARGRGDPPAPRGHVAAELAAPCRPRRTLPGPARGGARGLARFLGRRRARPHVRQPRGGDRARTRRSCGRRFGSAIIPRSPRRCRGCLGRWTRAGLSATFFVEAINCELYPDALRVDCRARARARDARLAPRGVGRAVC